MREHALGELASDAIPGGRPAGVNDATPTVAALEAEPFVELDAELDEVADACRSLVGEYLDCARTAKAPARSERVLGVERRIIVVPDSSGDAALSEEARRREERPLRENEDVAFGRSAESGEKSCHASADDDERHFAIGTCLPGIGHGSFSL